MAFSFILSTGRGFFRRKDLLFPDILSAVLCVFLLALGSSGTLYFLLPLGFGLLVGAFAYFFLTERKSYGFYWINHALYFALLIPRDQRFALHAIFAVLIGFGLWWIGERKLRIRFPLALVQLLISFYSISFLGYKFGPCRPGLDFKIRTLLIYTLAECFKWTRIRARDFPLCRRPGATRSYYYCRFF